MHLALIDLDGFRQINDGYSHARADQVLCQTARLCKERHSGGTTLARKDGDEFASLNNAPPKESSTRCWLLCELRSRFPFSFGLVSSTSNRTLDETIVVAAKTPSNSTRSQPNHVTHNRTGRQ
ncbi:diguanylate cyclase [Ferrimicrobium sp.]